MNNGPCFPQALAWLVAAVLASATPLAAQQQTRIEGVITDGKTLKPIEGIRVFAKNPGPIGQSDPTKADGRYKFTIPNTDIFTLDYMDVNAPIRDPSIGPYFGETIESLGGDTQQVINIRLYTTTQRRGNQRAIDAQGRFLRTSALTRLPLGLPPELWRPIFSRSSRRSST